MDKMETLNRDALYEVCKTLSTGSLINLIFTDNRNISNTCLPLIASAMKKDLEYHVFNRNTDIGYSRVSINFGDFEDEFNIMQDDTLYKTGFPLVLPNMNDQSESSGSFSYEQNINSDKISNLILRLKSLGYTYKNIESPKHSPYRGRSPDQSRSPRGRSPDQSRSPNYSPYRTPNQSRSPSPRRGRSPSS